MGSQDDVTPGSGAFGPAVGGPFGPGTDPAQASGTPAAGSAGGSAFGPAVGAGVDPAAAPFGPVAGAAEGSAFGPAVGAGADPAAAPFGQAPAAEEGGFGPPTGSWAPVSGPSRNLGWRPVTGSNPVQPQPMRAPEAGPADVEQTVRVPGGSGAPVSPPADADAAESRPRKSLWDDDELARSLVPKSGAGGDESRSRKPSSSLWDDDDLARKLAPKSVAAAAQETATKKRRLLPIVGAVVAVLVVLGGIAAAVVFAGRKPAPSPNAGPPPITTSISATPTSTCVQQTSGSVMTGNGPGDTSSGPGVIFGFQHAFYVERSGFRARDFVAPDAADISAPEVIQQGIDQQIPPGTTYCVRIDQRAPDSFDVDVTEHRPDGTNQRYPQVVRTVNRDGRWAIFSIVSR
ncbi:hypothetical protein [Nocardia stercoris]|uniref:DUF8176 domain-containing protein n=1 Tax=Nocardia stercoris TaxID=2483361 RepID=A0A3M2L430_9NOCA|nr:hypothetical protein [Nocardia stercoris]RMI31736.1 hypothetical protein EBN03_16175 [Nocardia stercoris]